MIGYSQKLEKLNAQANTELLGVRLGRHCIRVGIPVIDVANHFKVSRTAVYNWFMGLNEISPKHESKAISFIEWLKEA